MALDEPRLAAVRDSPDLLPAIMWNLKQETAVKWARDELVPADACVDLFVSGNRTHMAFRPWWHSPQSIMTNLAEVGLTMISDISGGTLPTGAVSASLTTAELDLRPNPAGLPPDSVRQSEPSSSSREDFMMDVSSAPREPLQLRSLESPLRLAAGQQQQHPWRLGRLRELFPGDPMDATPSRVSL